MSYMCCVVFSVFHSFHNSMYSTSIHVVYYTSTAISLHHIQCIHVYNLLPHSYFKMYSVTHNVCKSLPCKNLTFLAPSCVYLS